MRAPSVDAGASSGNDDKATIAGLRDSLTRTRLELSQTSQALAAAERELSLAREQVRMMRNSRAWKMTSPVRRLRRIVVKGDHW